MKTRTALAHRVAPTDTAELIEAAEHYEATAAGAREHAAHLLKAADSYEARATDYRNRAALAGLSLVTE